MKTKLLEKLRKRAEEGLTTRQLKDGRYVIDLPTCDWRSDTNIYEFDMATGCGYGEFEDLDKLADTKRELVRSWILIQLEQERWSLGWIGNIFSRI